MRYLLEVTSCYLLDASKGPVQDRFGPGPDRSWTGPVYGLAPTLKPIFGLGRSGPILDRWTPVILRTPCSIYTVWPLDCKVCFHLCDLVLIFWTITSANKYTMVVHGECLWLAHPLTILKRKRLKVNPRYNPILVRKSSVSPTNFLMLLCGLSYMSLITQLQEKDMSFFFKNLQSASLGILL